MSDFFASTRPGSQVKHGAATFDLPILYFRDDLFALFFAADYQSVKSQMPTDKLHPVRLPGSRAMVGVAAFHYIDTSIGPYGEVGVVLPCVHSEKPPPAILPGLMEGSYPNFGTLVLHLPVTGTLPRDAGRGQWGYTKFVADMHFTFTPEFSQVRMNEEDRHILTMRVPKRGFVKNDRKPLITFSVKDGDLIKTVIPQRGAYRFALRPKDFLFDLGDHPVGDSIRDLGLSARPLQSRYYVERAGILPAGEVVEQGVSPVDGYFGKDRQGQLKASYLDEGS